MRHVGRRSMSERLISDTAAYSELLHRIVEDDVNYANNSNYHWHHGLTFLSRCLSRECLVLSITLIMDFTRDTKYRHVNATSANSKVQRTRTGKYDVRYTI